MANEITVQAMLQVNNTNLNYLSTPTTFQATQNNVGGPTPGTITVSVAGTDVDLSELTVPGLCRMRNLDQSNYVQVGVWNPDQSEFYPLIRLKPGEFFVFRLDPDVNEEYSGTGTGTTGQLNTLRLKAANSSCLVEILVFED